MNSKLFTKWIKQLDYELIIQTGIELSGFPTFFPLWDWFDAGMTPQQAAEEIISKTVISF